MAAVARYLNNILINYIAAVIAAIFRIACYETSATVVFTFVIIRHKNPLETIRFCHWQ